MTIEPKKTAVLKKKAPKKEEPVDFLSRYVKPHDKVSRDVIEADIERVIEDAHVLFNLCYTQAGIYPGGFAVAHSQIDDKDPLRFFVTADKRIFINPVITCHTKVTVPHEEGCLTYFNERPKTVERWNKCEVEYQTLNFDAKITDPVKESLSGKAARIFQHEIDHMDGKYIYGI